MALRLSREHGHDFQIQVADTLRLAVACGFWTKVGKDCWRRHMIKTLEAREEKTELGGRKEPMLGLLGACLNARNAKKPPMFHFF